MTKIEWCDESWNPVIGCSKISTGCKNCYAERLATRLRHMEKNRSGEKRHYTNVVAPGGWNGRIHFIPDRLKQPLRWKKPRRVFVCSMGDLFHRNVPLRDVDIVFNAAWKAPQHIYLILTKRPCRMEYYFESCRDRGFSVKFWESHGFKLWKGVSVETQNQLLRAGELTQIPAAVRWISLEPLLGPIDLDGSLLWDIHWVVVGAETGPGARPMKLEWARDLLSQCRAAGVPFFFKAAGPKGTPIPDDLMIREYPE